jgi:hypothetical protein
LHRNAEEIALKLTLYVDNENLEDLVLRIVSLLPETAPVNVCNSLAALSRSLRQPFSEGGIVIVACSRASELKTLDRCRDRFREHQTVLILPEENREASIAGFDLNARVVLYPEDAKGYLAEILARLIRRFEKKPKEVIKCSRT